MEDSFGLCSYSGVHESDVKWLWYPYIPMGKITLIQGDPSDGKSTLALKIAAIASNGGLMPDGKKISKPLNVIYQCLEDGLSDTIKPRLIKYGANLDKVMFIKENDLLLSRLDRDILVYVLEKTDAKIFIIDPIQSFMGKDIQDIGSVRNYLGEIANIANQFCCSFIFIGHLNKNETGKDIYRGFGSIDIAAAARSILRVERIEDRSNVRVIRHIKSSLSTEGDDFAFEINSDNDVSWIGMVNRDIEGNDIAKQSKFNRSKKYEIILENLSKWLKNKDLSYTEIVNKTKKLDVGVRTLNEAKKELGIKSIKKNDRWYWHLEQEDGS